jgi:Protein of unknown function (DUF2442)
MDTPKIIDAEYFEEYKLRVCFEDGKSGLIDLEDQLWGEVFEPLKDVNEFRKFRVDVELATIVWSSGADLSPEFLYKHCR